MNKETFNFCKDVFRLIKDKTINITDSHLTRAGAVSMEDVYWIAHSCEPDHRLTGILDEATQIIRQELTDDIVKDVCKKLEIKDIGGEYWSDDVAELVNEFVPVVYDKSVILSKRYKVNLFIDAPDGKGGWMGMKYSARAMDKLLSDNRFYSFYENHPIREILAEDSLKRYDNYSSVVMTANIDLADIIRLAEKRFEARERKDRMSIGVRNYHLGIYDFGTRLYRGAVVRDYLNIPAQCIKDIYINDLGFKHQPVAVDGIDPAYPILTKSKHVPKTIISFF